MSSARTDGINPAYDKQNGYDTTRDRYPPDWDARSKAVRKRDDYICQDCGVKSGYHTSYGEGVTLDVHHVTFLSDGGSNRLSNLVTLCVDCHNDRHEHDITIGRDGYESAPSTSTPAASSTATTSTPTISSGLGVRGRLIIYCLIGVVVPFVHALFLSLLLTQPVGTPIWFLGAGYPILLAICLVRRPEPITVMYGVAGVVGGALILLGLMNVLVLSVLVPALLAAGVVYQQ